LELLLHQIPKPGTSADLCISLILNP